MPTATKMIVGQWYTDEFGNQARIGSILRSERQPAPRRPHATVS